MPPLDAVRSYDYALVAFTSSVLFRTMLSRRERVSGNVRHLPGCACGRLVGHPTYTRSRRFGILLHYVQRASPRITWASTSACTSSADGDTGLLFVFGEAYDQSSGSHPRDTAINGGDRNAYSVRIILMCNSRQDDPDHVPGAELVRLRPGGTTHRNGLFCVHAGCVLRHHRNDK